MPSQRDGNHEVRPLRINKLNLEKEEAQLQPSPQTDYKTDRKVNATIGTKTSNLRSFWSDMEKKDNAQSPPTPKPTNFRASQNSNRNSKVFENNIFVQSDRKGSTNSNTPLSPKADLNVMETTKEDELIRKSSIVRNGSVGRLHGPRQFSAEPQPPSPSKLKKVVTFNNSAQVIQYETVTPDISNSPSFESKQEEHDEHDEYREGGYDYEDDHSEEDESEDDHVQRYESSDDERMGHEHEDDHEESLEHEDDEHVPVIDPNGFTPSPVRVSHSRPLPQIPPVDDGEEEEEEEEEEAESDKELPVSLPDNDQESDRELPDNNQESDRELPVNLPETAPQSESGSESDKEEEEEEEQMDQIASEPESESGSGSESEGESEQEDEPTQSLTEPRPLPSEADMQNLRLPNNVSDLSRKDSLLDSERKVQTQHFTTTNESESPARTMSVRRKNLDAILEQGSKNLDETTALKEPFEMNVNGEPLADEEHQNDESQTFSVPRAPPSPPLSHNGHYQNDEELEEDTKLQAQLDRLDLGDLDFNQSEPLGLSDNEDNEGQIGEEAEEDDDDGLERSGTVIHRPNARKISPHLYYEPATEDAPHVPYRGYRGSPSPAPDHPQQRHATPPSIPVPTPPPQFRRQPTPPMPPIKQEPVDDDQSYRLPEFKQTTPLMGNEFEDVPIKQEPVEESLSSAPPPPPKEVGYEPRSPQLDNTEEPKIKQEYESPVPSLDHASPNSYNSPIKTERQTTPENSTEQWTPQMYNQREEELNLPSMADFESQLDSFTQDRDFSLRSLQDPSHHEKSSLDAPPYIKSEPTEHGQFDDTEDEEQEQSPEESEAEAPAGPKTIRASGSRLKTRPSLTPLDVRRISSSRRSSSGASKKKKKSGLDDQHIAQEVNRVPVPLLQLQYEQSTEGDSLFGDLDEQFDKLFEKEKRGYTVHENERIVIATERKYSGGGRKVSGPVKTMPVVPEKPLPGFSIDNAPPLPPKSDDNNEGDNTTDQHQQQQATAPQEEDRDLPSSDKGRLFVRVVSLKDIDLPGVDEKRAKFNLTLDNGIHCITTQNKPLNKTAFLDQEFELTVGEDLEFILTVKAKYTKPSAAPVRKPVHSFQQPAPPPSPASTKQPESKARHGFSKLFGSPKKKQQPPPSPRPPPTPQLQPAPSIPQELRRDPWESIVANDGSFGRCYVAFSQYQKEVFGRPATFEIPCFNEWARGPDRSKKQPYKIGKMQVQMMFVPRASRKEQLPKSIKEALDELREARKHEPMLMEGCLSQLGGDCRYWRRRYFKMEGTMLTAYSETSGKPRATINLSKAVRVIDDKGTLSQPTVQVGKNRRKSAFSQQEEAFMFVNEAFRIRFKNNEIIDFYADSSDMKQQWISTLIKVIGTAPTRNPWTDLVMRRVAE